MNHILLTELLQDQSKTCAPDDTSGKAWLLYCDPFSSFCQILSLILDNNSWVEPGYGRLDLTHILAVNICLRKTSFSKKAFFFVFIAAVSAEYVIAFV